MKAPTRIPHKKSHCWNLPDREWLYNEYTILKKSASQIGKKIGVSSLIVRKWLERLEISKRTLAEAQALRRGVDYEVSGRLQHCRKQARKIMVSAGVP
jgi:hypothetical protein